MARQRVWLRSLLLYVRPTVYRSGASPTYIPPKEIWNTLFVERHVARLIAKQRRHASLATKTMLSNTPSVLAKVPQQSPPGRRKPFPCHLSLAQFIRTEHVTPHQASRHVQPGGGGGGEKKKKNFLEWGEKQRQPPPPHPPSPEPSTAPPPQPPAPPRPGGGGG